MMTLTRKLLLLVLATVLAPCVQAFSPIGPPKGWQVTGIGYQLPEDIGAPMTRGEFYRWNVPVIYYAFDYTFITYFGPDGMAAVDAAMKVFTDLPKLSQITNDGSSLYIRGEPVPTDAEGPPNFGFGVAGLLDLKSRAMQIVIEELGLAQPERWTWALRDRSTETIAGEVVTNYAVIKLNYDPISLQPSSFVNGTAFDYIVDEPLRPPINYADALEVIDGLPAPYAYRSIASYSYGPGRYFFGLTHDDVGGLRMIYNVNTFANELLLPNVTGGPNRRGTGSPWRPFLGITNTALLTNVFVLTNSAGTNLIIQGLRPGINKITFKRANYDSLLGQFFTRVTNAYTDMVISNSRPVIQSVQRVLTAPDIIFTAGDCGVDAFSFPNLNLRTDTTRWQNNGPINGVIPDSGAEPRGGPGVILGPVQIRFSDILPYFYNRRPDFENGPTGPLFESGVWGSFDENTVEPIIYPFGSGLTLKDLQRRALRGP